MGSGPAVVAPCMRLWWLASEAVREHQASIGDWLDGRTGPAGAAQSERSGLASSAALSIRFASDRLLRHLAGSDARATALRLRLAA